MKRNQWTSLVMIAVVLIASGCGKSSDDSAPITQRNSRVNSTSVPGPFQTSSGNGGQFYYTAATGRVYTDAQYGQAFTGAMASLVSVSFNSWEEAAQNVGTVSPTDGVKLRGYVEVDSFGNPSPGRSSLQLEIRDSLAGTVDPQGNVYAPILIQVPLASGRVYNGVANLTFSDSLGSITLNGYYQGQTFYGQLSFRNNNGRSGDNLQFQIDTCGFFRCQ